jgi:hypothetical protein
MLAGGLAGKDVCDTRDKDGVHRSTPSGLGPLSGVLVASMGDGCRVARPAGEHTPAPHHP